MITPDQITITSDLVYEGEGLVIGYFNGPVPGILILSQLQLMNHLSEIGLVTDKEKYRIKTDYAWISLEHYMGNHLNKSLAQAIVANYLNTRTPKPVAK